MATNERRVAFDLESYVARVRGGDCFVCGIVAGDPRFPAADMRA